MEDYREGDGLVSLVPSGHTRILVHLIYERRGVILEKMVF